MKTRYLLLSTVIGFCSFCFAGPSKAEDVILSPITSWEYYDNDELQSGSCRTQAIFDSNLGFQLVARDKELTAMRLVIPNADFGASRSQQSVSVILPNSDILDFDGVVENKHTVLVTNDPFLSFETFPEVPLLRLNIQGREYPLLMTGFAEQREKLEQCSSRSQIDVSFFEDSDETEMLEADFTTEDRFIEVSKNTEESVSSADITEITIDPSPTETLTPVQGLDLPIGVADSDVTTSRPLSRTVSKETNIDYRELAAAQLKFEEGQDSDIDVAESINNDQPEFVKPVSVSQKSFVPKTVLQASKPMQDGQSNIDEQAIKEEIMAEIQTTLQKDIALMMNQKDQEIAALKEELRQQQESSVAVQQDMMRQRELENQRKRDLELAMAKAEKEKIEAENLRLKEQKRLLMAQKEAEITPTVSEPQIVEATGAPRQLLRERYKRNIQQVTGLPQDEIELAEIEPAAGRSDVADSEIEVINMPRTKVSKPIDPLTESSVKRKKASQTRLQGSELPVKLVEKLEPQVVPKWNAQKGENLKQVLTSWSMGEGVEIIWDAPDKNYAVLSNVSMSDRYEMAIAELLHQYATTSGVDKRPIGQLFVDPTTKKRVLVVSQADAS